ncbi:non-ribosomal peptide synthetase [Aquisphaera insulae]|uniref:non-ribosomal peptide synthetase n=1 Tax=Aquisphaera insulae TaxID=2712864 RepID=UPI0013EC59D3|nr:non-ribosomal peptide synthetase [Aquisphaera insulae]
MNSFSDQAIVTLHHLLNRGVRLRADGEHLRLVTGGARLDEGLIEEARLNKPGLIEIVGREKLACLTPAQERLWFLAQLGGAEAYNLPGLARIDGPLDLRLLRESLDALMGCHESLRTRFPSLPGGPVQAIAASVTVPFVVHDVADETEAMAMARELIGRPFDLRRRPLFLADVARWSPRACLVLLRMPHILSDGWSLRIMLDELSAAYARLSRGEPAGLLPRPLQYSGYAAWLRACDRSSQSDSARLDALRFWERTLVGVEDLDLRTDFPRPEVLSGRGSVVTAVLGVRENRAIAALCRVRKVTPLSVWIAAVYLVLGRRSRDTDFCLGIPATGRGRPELSSVVGLFVNTLIVRPAASLGERSAGQLVATAQEALTAAMDHRDVPVEDIIARLNPPRRMNRTPLFQVLVNHASEPLDPPALGDATLTPILPESDWAKFEWTFSITEQCDGGALLAVEFATDLFRPVTASRIAEEVARAAWALASEPERPLDRIDLLSDSDRRQLLEWGRRPASPIPEPRAHEWLARWARSHPGAIAMEDSDRTWSFQEVDEASDRLAAALRRRGTPSGACVAVCVARSAGYVVAVFGALKAGAAYLPVDPDEAELRLMHMLRETRAAAMIVDGSTPFALREAANRVGCRTHELDADGGEVPRRSALPGGLAYVMYTSGTTGRPKGVMIEHGSLSSYIAAVVEEYGLTSSDRVAQLSTPAFDIFVEEVFPTVRSGATLVILDDEARRDPRRAARLVRDRRITVLDLPTSYFHLLAEDPRALDDLGASLRLVIVGGERLDASAARRFLERCGSTRLVNTYGPTETTVICTAHALEPGWTGSEIPIGRPIAGVELLVLDRGGRMVPIGSAGELHVGGPGLMRGYLNQPRETATALVPHPLHPGKRIYRTGDLVVWGGDGSLRFVGRGDLQLKIRGHRVEPAEVEAALGVDPEVGGAAVVSAGEEGDRRLIAFVTPSDARPIDGRGVRRRLADRLPSYMIPAEVIAVESFPLAGGKLDRRTLAAWAVPKSPGMDETEPNAASSPLEARLGRHWCGILGREHVDPNEHFFESGGHSLAAVQLIRRLEAEFGISIPVADLFSHPTLRDIAGRVRSLLGKSAPSSARATVLRKPVASFILPGLPGIGGQYYELAECLATEGEILALSLPGYEGEDPATTVEEMASHWRSAVEHHASDRPVRFLAHSYAGTVLYEMLRSRDEARFQVESVILLDSMPHERMARLDADLLATWESALGLDVIPEARGVVEAALRAPHPGPSGRLDYQVTLVVAEQSRSWMDRRAWGDYFKGIRVVETAGDHLSIVRRQDCRRWIERVLPCCQPSTLEYSR